MVAFRTIQRRKRARAVSARPARRRDLGPRRIPTGTVRALGLRVSAGLLIAEGNSWFDYPMNDVLRLLEDDHGFDVESVANAMLKQVSSAPQFRHVRYVDLRTTLASDQTYRRDWANELHPTARGFAAVTAKFASVIAGL